MPCICFRQVDLKVWVAGEVVLVRYLVCEFEVGGISTVQGDSGGTESSQSPLSCWSRKMEKYATKGKWNKRLSTTQIMRGTSPSLEIVVAETTPEGVYPTGVSKAPSKYDNIHRFIQISFTITWDHDVLILCCQNLFELNLTGFSLHPRRVSKMLSSCNIPLPKHKFSIQYSLSPKDLLKRLLLIETYSSLPPSFFFNLTVLP